MHHVLAFNANVAVSQTDVQLPALSDQEYSRQNSNFELRVDHNLLALYASGLGLVRTRINTATLRLRGFPQVQPTNKILLPPTDPNFYDLRYAPLKLRAQEDFRIDVTTDATAGPNQTYLLAWVTPALPGLLPAEGVPSDQQDARRQQLRAAMQVSSYDMRWIRATSSVTAIAQAWSGLGTITFDDTQESTRYAVWGLEVFGANIIAARIQFQGQALRPGCVGNASAGLRSHDSFRAERGMGYGLWGVYDTYQAPQIETLENAAGASTPEIFLLVSKL